MKRLIQVLLALGLLAALLCVAGVALFYAFILRELPEIYTLKDYTPKLVTRVHSHDGVQIGSFYRERREIVPIENVPTHLVHAFIAAEDGAFYQHEGLDYAGILRAAIANLKAGGITQGGSTITQQVAKTLLLTSDRTWLRKVKDMILAQRIEKYLNKNEILYLYLNQIYLGSGAYGVESAAQTYFGKSVSGLSLAESALIAGLVPAPSRYSPRANPAAAQNRQRFVLRRMEEERFISSEQRTSALEQELKFEAVEWDETRAAAAYFVEEVRRYLERHYGSEEMLTGGLNVRTTLDIERQIDAYRAVRRGLRDQDRRQGFRGPIRSIPRMQWTALLEELAQGASPSLEPGLTIVPALVVDVDDKAQQVRLALGPERQTFLSLEDLKWAGEPDKEIDGAVPRVKKVSQALAVGYLVWLEQVGERPPEAVELEDPNLEAIVLGYPNLGAVELEPIPVYALYQPPNVEGSLVAMDVETGNVRALIGGYSFHRSQFNRAVQSRRQPGSAFKPIIYAAALKEGYTPATIVYDTPIVYEDTESGITWKPGNYSDKFYGPITLRSALAHSRNVATIKVLRAIGIPPVLEMAHATGIRASLEANLSLALGSSEVTLTELVRAYATFASGGRRVTPRFILEVRDREGKLLEENVPLLPADQEAAEQDQFSIEQLLAEIRSTVDREDDPDALPPGYMLDPVIAYLMTDLLRAVVQEGTGWRAKALRRPVAGKTGTTNNLHDAWFVGYTPQVVTGVWVGYDVAQNLGKNETGSRAAAPIFVDYMRTALAELPPLDFSAPRSVVFARIDRKTGLLAHPGDDKAVFQPFREGTVPEEMAPQHAIFGSIRPTRLD
ncbi:MAG: PBP1A family penicillin-binding protein [Deltaproteobacteria bacterium]|nr:MAG: PBP1A family penicillin-binding protein [Deltaproteobacteria bacterium]